MYGCKTCFYDICEKCQDVKRPNNIDKEENNQNGNRLDNKNDELQTATISRLLCPISKGNIVLENEIEIGSEVQCIL